MIKKEVGFEEDLEEMLPPTSHLHTYTCRAETY